jgi:hypothetical protein
MSSISDPEGTAFCNYRDKKCITINSASVTSVKSKHYVTTITSADAFGNNDVFFHIQTSVAV